MLLEWGDPTGPQTEMNAGQNRVAPKTTHPALRLCNHRNRETHRKPGQTMRFFTPRLDMGKSNQAHQKRQLPSITSGITHDKGQTLSQRL
jgi:hypothetical protein